MSGGWLARAGERLIGSPVTKLLQFIQPFVGSSSSTPLSSTSGAEIERAHKDLAYVQQTWERIEVFLEDAEQREVQDKSVRLWLGDLRALSEEAEDLLDFCQYEAVAMEIQDHEEARVTRTLGERKGVDDQVCVSSKESFCNPLYDPKFRQKVVDGVQKIRDRFDEINKLRDALNLKDCGEARTNRSIIDRPPSGYCPSEPNIVGRERVLPQVVNVLTGGDDTRLQVPVVVALVGMGGVGKTTLAQHAFNTPAVSAHFDTMAWVCVSDEFELISLTKKVLEAFTKEDSGLIGLSVLQKKLLKQVKGKKFLLVMDDIWNEKALLWEKFLSCLRCGMTGSKILITTRNHSVAKKAHAVETIELGCLSKVDAWNLFEQYAFRSHEHSENYHELLPIGREIAKKCKGLPLALKILGSRLSCDSDDPNVWRDVLESTLWEPHIWGDGKQILGPLLLSYLNLPAYLKPCLRLCGVFPKDTRLSKEELISLWVAHDKVVVKDRDNWMDLEAMARKYIAELTARSFLHKIDFLLMHDLIHDLVQFLTKDEHNNYGSGIDFVERTAKPGGVMRSLFLEGGSIPDYLNLERLRVLSYKREPYNLSFCASSSVISRNLRTVLLSVDKIERTGLERICKLYNLRELDIDMVSGVIIPYPESIGNLKHLLRLSLKYVCAQDLPESLFLLPKLQDLCLTCEDDGVFTFPNNVSNLTSLQRLIINERYGFPRHYLPAGFGRLRNIKFINYFPVGCRSEHAGLKELGDLVHLQGDLCITRLRNASLDDSKQAGLMKTENLKSLELWWNEKIPEADFEVAEEILEFMQHDEQLLENLRPHPNLRDLLIDSWRGAQLPSWLGDDPSHLTRLNTLHFGRCAGLVSLPPIGHIPTLEHLIIDSCPIECIPADFFSSTLRTLEVFLCEDLTSMFLYRLSALEELSVLYCSRLQVIRFTGPLLMGRTILGANPVITTLELYGCPLLRDMEFPLSATIFSVV